MKAILLTFFSLLAFGNVSKEKICNLQGKVRIVQSHAHYRVYIKDNNPDLHVKIVPAFANKPGKWQIVTMDEDFTVQFVDNQSIADFTIRFSIFPGGGSQCSNT